MGLSILDINMDTYYGFLDRGFDWGKSSHPDAPIEHHYAFANSVAYAMTGLSGGYGGPSMREHLASRIIVDAFGGTGKCDLEDVFALTRLDECCYGPLTKEHALMLQDENCYDDIPEEVEKAEKMLLET